MNRQVEEVTKRLVEEKRSYMNAIRERIRNDIDSSVVSIVEQCAGEAAKKYLQLLELAKDLNVIIKPTNIPIAEPGLKYLIVRDKSRKILLPDGRETTVYQIRSLKRDTFGEYGGWIESEHNLSQTGDCWIDEDAVVCGNAQVLDDATVHDHGLVYGNAIICDDGDVCDMARVYDHAIVRGTVADYCHVGGNARIGSGVMLETTIDISSTVTIENPHRNTLARLSILDPENSKIVKCYDGGYGEDVWPPEEEYYFNLGKPTRIVLQFDHNSLTREGEVITWSRLADK